MRSKVLFVFVMILTVLIAGGAFACKVPVTVSVPTGVMVEGDFLVWNEVSGASEYRVVVDEEEEITVYDTRYKIELYDSVTHSLTVSAVTPDGRSAESEPAYYKYENTNKPVLSILDAPTLRITATRLMWNNVLGNSGYRIYFNGTTIDVEKNKTQYDITFPKDGDYIIGIQTLGDGVTYYSSRKYELKVTSREGKANLLPLAAVTLRYDSATRKLEWANKAAGSSVKYKIYKVDEAQNEVLEAQFDSDPAKATMSYAPILNGSVVSYTVMLSSNDGLYSDSPKSEPITFPILESAVTGLRLEQDEEGTYDLIWDACKYAHDYVVTLDGAEHSVSETKMSLPAAVGDHVVRVKAVGDNVYLGGSLSSREMSFTFGEGGVFIETLGMPTIRNVFYDEEKCRIILYPVDRAAGYRLRIATADETLDVMVREAEFAFLRTSADATIIKLFSMLDAGGRLSVSAVSDQVGLLDSPYCAETILIEGVEAVAAPTGLTFSAGGVKWDSVQNAEKYSLSVDGEVVSVKGTRYEPSFTTGDHVFKVAVEADNALYSEEIFVSLPLKIGAPSALQVTASTLSYVKDSDASYYQLYANGTPVAEVSASQETVDLSLYITTDGTYVLSLRSCTRSKYCAESLLSEEVLYVKTDGKEGTASKPYRINSAAEMVSMLVADPSAYFTFTKAKYDFKGVDITPLYELTFEGHLIGKNAVLENITARRALFGSLKNAEIADLTFKITTDRFLYDRSGILAGSMDSATLRNVNLTFSGETALAKDVTFGLVTYEAKDVTFTSLSVISDGLKIASAQKATVGGVAYKLSGTVTDLRTSGTLMFPVGEIVFGGVSAEESVSGAGECALTNATLAMGVRSATARTAALYGVTVSGSIDVTGGAITAASRLEGTDNVHYYGVTKENVSVTSAAIGGSLTLVDVRYAEVYGIAGGQSGKIVNTTASLCLVGSATEQIVAAGIAERIGEELYAEGLTFAGDFTLSAPRVQGAGVSLFGDVSFTATVSGKLAASGEETLLLVGGVSEGAGADITFTEGAEISLSDASSGTIAGVALDSSGTVAARGSLNLSGENCEQLFVSGVFGGDEGMVDVEGFTVSGTLSASELCFGGVSGAVSVLSGRIASLTVNVTVESDDLTIGGAVGNVTSLDLSEKAVVTANITASGTGKVGGFAAEALNDIVENVQVKGSMSFRGEGELCGVVCRAYAADSLECGADLTATGNVILCGIADEIGEGTQLTVKNATFTITSDQAKMYGIAASVPSLSAKVSGVTFIAAPAASGGTLELYGMAETLGSSSGLLIENTAFTIGAFDTAEFAAVAKTSAGSLRSGSFGYTLDTSAATSTIGGTFSEASGTINGFTIGTTASPVRMTIKGNATLGGISATTGPSLTVENSTVDLRLAIDLPAANEVKAGGAFAIAENSVTMTNTTVSITLVERKGAGAATVGGAVAELSGDLSGARTKVSLSSDIAEDVFGGVAAVMRGGDLTASSAQGSLSAGKAGGLVGVATKKGESKRAVIKECATVLSVPNGAGLVYDAEYTNISDCYSLATAYAGVIYRGKNVRVENGYFGGAAEYSVGYDLTDPIFSGFFVEAALRHVKKTDKGDVTPIYKTLAYGCDADALTPYFDREIWSIEAERYPYLTALGSIGATPSGAAQNLESVEITDGMDLYEEAARRTVAGDLPAVVWVDQSGNMDIEDGIVTLSNDEEGMLYGCISGGKCVYILPYEIKGFEPFEGRGTEADPYVVTSLKNLKHVPRFADQYYEDRTETAHFRIAAGTYEDVVLPAIMKEYAAIIDCTGVVLVSPTIAAGGIFGTMTGGSVSGLTIRDAVYEDVLLFAGATDVSVSGVSVSLTASGDVSVMGNMTGGSLTNVSLSVEEDAYDFTVHLVDRTENVTFLRVQFFLSASARSQRCSIVGEDVASTFTNCAVYIAADIDEVYPFAYTANGTTVRESSAVVYGMSNARALCSDKKEVQLSDLVIRYCDCDLYGTGDAEDISAHQDTATLSESALKAADELAETFAALIGHYAVTDESAQWELSSPSEAYDAYSAFYTKVCAFFGVADAGVVGGATHTLTSGAVIGADKPFSIVFNDDDTTSDLRSILARSLGCETADDLAARAQTVAALLSSDLCDADTIGGRVVYDGAIYTESGYFLLPYAFVCGNNVTLACAFVSPDGMTSVWVDNVASAKSTTNASGGGMFSMRITTDVYGRCALFDSMRVAPVKRALGVKYTDLLFAVDGETKAIGGVTFTSFGAVKARLGTTPYSYDVTGALATPVGYDRFGRGEETYTFTLTDDEGEVETLTLDGVTEWNAYEDWSVYSDAPFGEAVSFTLTPALGEISRDGVLRIAANGTGTLTVTNAYGESKAVSVTIQNYYGYEHGSGTEEDPYEIHTLADLEMMTHFEDAHFILKENIDDTLTAPIAVVGATLHGDGKTIRLTLDGADRVFSAYTGAIEHLRFEIVTAETTGAAFLEESSLLQLTDVTFVLANVTMNVGEGERVGLIFNEITGSPSAWSGVTLDLTNVTVSAPSGGCVGLLVGRAEGFRMEDVDLTASSVTLTAGGALTFGGIAGEYESGIETGVLLSDITIVDLTLTGTLANAADSLVFGGAVGSLSAAVTGVDATVDITLNADDKLRGDVTLGGVVGNGYSALSEVTVDGTITVYAAEASVGGVAGYASATLTDVNVDVTVSAECAARALVGGVAGRLDAAIVRGSGRGTVTALSHATDDDLESLENEEDVILAVASAGGAAGYMEGTLQRYTVSSVSVTATATGVTHGYVLAGGAAGYLADAFDIVIDGAALTATGADSAAGGVAGVLKRDLEHAVISGVTLFSATYKGGAVGVFSLVDESSVDGVICTADVGETGAAIVDHIVTMKTVGEDVTGAVSNCRYLYGKAIGDGEWTKAYDVNNVKESGIAALHGTSAYINEYVSFDEDVWAFDDGKLPTLKTE